MDKFGVPKTINRHVLKAIYELDNESSDFSDICNMVQISIKNNRPVPNLLKVIRQSLLNLSKLGVIRKQGTNYSRNFKNLKKLRSAALEGVWDVKPGPLAKKRHLHADDIPTENLPKSSRKSFAKNRIISRKIRGPYLPKNRIHTDFQLSHSDGEMELHLYGSSDDGSELNWEDMKRTTFPSKTELKSSYKFQMFETAMVEADGLDDINENSNNLFEPQNQNIAQNSQQDEVEFPDQINNMNVFNESQSQLKDKEENKSNSESMETSKDTQDYQLDSNVNIKLEEIDKNELSNIKSEAAMEDSDSQSDNNDANTNQENIDSKSAA